MSKLFNEIVKLDTEAVNSASLNIDNSSTEEILRIINAEDQKVALAVEHELPYIAKAVDLITDAFACGGRLFYFGAGTSGRLGVVDASECPPTFGADPEMVQGFIAGGMEAMFVAQEGAEDDRNGAKYYFDKYHISSHDIVCGIAASGRTPFVLGALEIAKNMNIKSIMVSTINRTNAEHLVNLADVLISPFVGPEVIAGSTRMKSGTAQKMVLNMLTTAAFVKLGKTYNNIMIDLQLTNKKLEERAKGILMKICGVDYSHAENILRETGEKVKTAIVMLKTNSTKEKAETALQNAGGKVKIAINNLSNAE